MGCSLPLSIQALVRLTTLKTIWIICKNCPRTAQNGLWCWLKFHFCQGFKIILDKQFARHGVVPMTWFQWKIEIYLRTQKADLDICGELSFAKLAWNLKREIWDFKSLGIVGGLEYFVLGFLYKLYRCQFCQKCSFKRYWHKEITVIGNPLPIVWSQRDEMKMLIKFT